MIDEENIGKDIDGKDSIHCKVQVQGRSKRFIRELGCDAVPGSAIRVSLSFRRGNGASLLVSARLLAFVDPLTGRAVVRMGMYDTSKSRSGKEVGQQIVWDSDVQVCEVD